MSFRARLSLVMALVVFAPLITAGVVLLWRVPELQADRAASVSQQAAAAGASSLAGSCVAVGDTVRGVTQAVAAAATAEGFDGTAVTQVTDEAADGHPGMSIVVLDAEGEALAFGGPLDPGTAAQDAAANAGGSCSQARSPKEPALAESAPIRVSQDGVTKTVAEVVAWISITDRYVDELATSLALPQDTELAVTSVSTGEVVASSDPAAVTDAVTDAVSDSPAEGAPAQVSTRKAASTGFAVAAVTRPETVLSPVLLLPAFALALAGLALALVVTSRLTRPLAHVTEVADRLGKDPSARTGLTSRDEVGRLGASFDAMADELQLKAEELERQIEVQTQAAALLKETFAQFGEALGSTHNLGALLEAVLQAGVEGSRAGVGSIHVVDGGSLQEMAVVPQGDHPDPEERDALAGLRALAAECYRTGTATTLPEVDGGGVAMAVPLRSHGSLVGVVSVARRAGATAFDPAAQDRLTSLAQNAGTAIANVRDHEESRRLSVTDELTGTGNLRRLTDTLHHEVDRSARFGRALSVLMLDLDYFKQVNDTLGHSFGDGVLRQFAQRVEGCLRDVDTVARYGGEEFAVILPETDAAGATRVAERIVQAVRSAPFVVGDRSRHVTVSVGVAQFPIDGRTSSEVMRAADAALYNAKRTGRDRWSLAAGESPADLSGLDEGHDASAGSDSPARDR